MKQIPKNFNLIFLIHQLIHIYIVSPSYIIFFNKF